MPIYAYQCQACGHELESIQKISDSPLTDCPVCHESRLKKMLTAPAFRLSGSGWYETDFKKDNRKNLAGDKASGTDSGTAKAPESGKSEGGGAGKDATPPKTADAG